MKRRVAAVSLLGMAALSYWCLSSATAGGQNFDKLNDADRKVFAERFEREVWPLLVRGGKDGCVGCHRGGKIVSALRFSGNVDKDFLMLLKDGFFLHPDDGSLLARLTDKVEIRTGITVRSARMRRDSRTYGRLARPSGDKKTST